MQEDLIRPNSIIITVSFIAKVALQINKSNGLAFTSLTLEHSTFRHLAFPAAQ